QDQIISHATRSKLPNPILVLTSIRMRIKVSRTVVVRFFEQLNQEEQVLDRLRAKAEILIEPRALLIVEIDMKQLAGFNCLGHNVVEIETGHLFVADFRIDANHLRMFERG